VSLVGVVAKQPRSWWPVEGEIRLSERHDKVAVGGEQVIGPYDEESCARVVNHPRESGNQCGSRASSRRVKARDGAKSLDVQRLGTRRPRGSGTITQSITEQERSVSTPASLARRVLPSGAPVTAKPISVAREVVERRAEVGGGSSSGDRRGQQNPS
jgi:hypothetical protein